MSHSEEIIRSWQANADNWISTIDGGEIESRTRVTNAAIINAVLLYRPAKVLDIGCGEGWLTRALQESGIEACGIDAVEGLIKNAIEKGGQYYSVCTYDDLVKDRHPFVHEVDAAVINFALLDKENTEQLIRYLGGALRSTCLIFIQTLHPLHNILNDSYESGWKEGSWNGLRNEFVLPYKWYFRTLEDWVALFTRSGLKLIQLKVPLASR